MFNLNNDFFTASLVPSGKLYPAISISSSVMRDKVGPGG